MTPAEPENDRPTRRPPSGQDAWPRGRRTESDLEDLRDYGDFETCESAVMNEYERQFGW